MGTDGKIGDWCCSAFWHFLEKVKSVAELPFSQDILITAVSTARVHPEYLGDIARY